MSAQSLTRSSFLRQLATDGPDSEVWSDLQRRYGDWVFHTCRRWGASTADAEDLTQETLLRVYQHIQGYQHSGPFSFRAWIRTVARTTWLMLLRQRSRRPVLVSMHRPASGSAADEAQDRDLSAMYQQLSREAEQLEQQELLEVACKRVRARVNASMWQAFQLLSQAEYAAEDAAGMLGVSRATVYLWNTRIRQLLAEEIASMERG
ncbi:MAG: RNA polymerase sigma factor [Planctomycetaceae bacterium]